MTPSTLSRAFLLVALLGASGCGLLTDKRAFGPTLADLPEAEVPASPEPMPKATLAQIEESYRAALDVAETPQMRHRITVRLADIEMARSENRQLSQAEQSDHFQEAIAMYDELLLLNETKADAATDERLLYRLSKAYALDGRMAESDAALARLIELYPQSPYAAEAEFRRAEQAFNRGDYDLAQALFQQVVEAGSDTPFHLNAVYMLGWSQFKANDFHQSVHSFTQVLDELLIEEQADSLDSAKKGLLDDTFRVLAITFTYLDGAQAITDLYQGIGERPYQHRIYRQLAELYFDKRRYQDAADTYAHFIEAFPASNRGPEFAIDRMEVFRAGGFAQKMLPAKEQYVRQYGVHSPYWAGQSEEQRAQLRDKLRGFLEELSSYYHSEGQALAAAQSDYQKRANAGRKAKRPEPAAPYFIRAAQYYDEYLQTFPDSPRIAEITFLRGEALYEAGALEQAVDAYEKVAYDLLDSELGARAGYAAIVTLQTLLEGASSDELKAQFSAHKIDSAISFADYYPHDERAVPVLTAAAEDVFEQGAAEQAVAIANRVVQWQPMPSASQRKTAWLIIAHHQFDQAEYSSSEQSYRQALALMAPEDESRGSVRERIAASMFKQAEALIAAGDSAAGVDLLLDIESVAPGTELAISAQYDAGNYLMEMQDWQRAERVFADFAQRFADHALAATLLPKQALIYQELQQWGKAASVLASMANDPSDPDAARQALYLSAELYQKADRPWDAALIYADYVERYPQPFELATEARFQLLQLAEQRDDANARNRWLQRLINAHASAGSSGTERSRYLAAFSANQLAGQAFAKFESIKLTLPIKKSLQAKKAALDETLKAYRKVLDYGVGEFVTEANYRIGNVYSQLSRDLLASERPKGLDPLAMEQYEILLEEQAYPFEDKSVQLLEATAERAWDGFYDDWVKRSFAELATILPARYGKQEVVEEVSDGVH